MGEIISHLRTLTHKMGIYIGLLILLDFYIIQKKELYFVYIESLSELEVCELNNQIMYSLCM